MAPSDPAAIPASSGSLLIKSGQPAVDIPVALLSVFMFGSMYFTPANVGILVLMLGAETKSVF